MKTINCLAELLPNGQMNMKPHSEARVIIFKDSSEDVMTDISLKPLPISEGYIPKDQTPHTVFPPFARSKTTEQITNPAPKL